MEDEKIIGLFFDRSEQAVRELDRKYGGLCRGLSRNIVGCAQDAEECVNDAYLGMWNTVPPERPSPLSAYLCRIVRNLSLKQLSKNRAGKRSSEYEISMQELSDCLTDRETAETRLEARELARLIGSFLDTLSRENRFIFIRRYWFCDSYGDIAALVGLSVKNVSVRLTRIRGMMRKYLSEKGVVI